MRKPRPYMFRKSDFARMAREDVDNAVEKIITEWFSSKEFKEAVKDALDADLDQYEDEASVLFDAANKEIEWRLSEDTEIMPEDMEDEDLDIMAVDLVERAIDKVIEKL